MKVLETTSTNTTIQVSLSELITLNNCMNEAFELDVEFSTRVGIDKKSALKLFNTINNTVEQMQALTK
jgi:uncharacterized protein YqgV (UPF0045/DUF77 family)